MINWRKPILHTIYYLAGNPTLRRLRYLKSVERLSSEQLQQSQKEKLRQLLLHAYRNVPYYHDILDTAGVVKNNTVSLENFQNIPILTKKIIRQQGDKLYSKDYRKRNWYLNTSGGSTGEPVTFVQDKSYKAWGMAHQYYFSKMCGQDIGEPMIKLWGSERDVFRKAERISTRLQRSLFNVTFLNSFMMSDESMGRYVILWNRIKPKLVHSYASSIFELGRYIKRSGAKIFSPTSIICTAETLTKDIRKLVEQVFDCPVLDQYGSREVGIVACECLKKEGLHTFPLHNKMEILDENLKPCQPGHMGEIYVTNLNNYSMPIIRYKIGDTAVITRQKYCSCDRGWPLIASVTGRQSDHFRTRDGKLIHGEYFTHLFYGKTEVKRFRVIQHEYDDVEILVVPTAKISDETIKDIESKIKLVLGEKCKISFNEVDKIPPTASGKYRYTISKVAT